MTPDYVNALFEFGGAGLLLMNVSQLYRDKALSGVRILPTAFFSAWGLWNLFYYPSLDQWASFIGGVAIVSVNVAWVAMALHYSKRATV